ncbi:MAG TPA: ornithine carbamoyltransferase [Coriobacteriia bacterium]
MGLQGNDLLTLGDITSDDVRTVIERAVVQKRMWNASSNRPRPLADRAVAIVMLKPSMRTRVSFEVAVRQLGGTPIVLGADSVFSRGETVEDTAKVLERYCDCIVLRTFEQSHLEEVAHHASVPVINALTDDYHPCQVLADLLTIHERKGELAGLKLAYVGDGNNMANTLLIGGAHVGMNVTVACPQGFVPLPAAIERAEEIAAGTGAQLRVVSDAGSAVTDADVVVTDTWTSMGQEEEHDRRLAEFRGYTVNGPLMALAKPDAIFMHCLPAHRGEEVLEEVIDGPQSVIYEEAGNRMRAQKALLSLIMG